MASKSNAFPLLQSFIMFVKNQFDVSVKIVRSDNRMEFQDHSALQFYAQQGIIHQKSCVDTSQQNDIVERKHKHLLEVAKALMIQANLPQRFWGDSILTAVYFINRFPTPLLHNMTPFEILYNEKPAYTHLRTFGCLCYASTLKKAKSKFIARATTCIFIGYPYGQKAYKLYELETKKVFVSRDVIFHENCFPYMQQDHVSSLPLPPLIQDEEDSLVQPVPQQRTSADTDVISSHITEASSDLDTSLQPVPPSVEAPILTRRSTRAHKVFSYLPGLYLFSSPIQLVQPSCYAPITHSLYFNNR